MTLLPNVPGAAPPHPSLVKRRVAAEILGMSARWLDGAVKRGEIPVIRCGRAVRFDTRDLVAFIEKNRSSNVHPTGNVAGDMSHLTAVLDGSKGPKNEEAKAQPR